MSESRRRYSMAGGHPNGASLQLSGEDKIQLAWLRETLKIESRPAISLVLGRNKGEVYLAE